MILTLLPARRAPECVPRRWVFCVCQGALSTMIGAGTLPLVGMGPGAEPIRKEV
jgi:hypothetical protein